GGGWDSAASGKPSLFTIFTREQPLKLVTLPQTKSMFSHVGWTAGMEWKSYSRDTGLTRSKRQGGVNRWFHRPRNATVPSNYVAGSPLRSSLVTSGFAGTSTTICQSTVSDDEIARA